MNLTITLTLKGRDDFTYRWMDYMNEMCCPCKILIADGGASPELEEHLRNSNNYKNINYDYIRFPFDANTNMFYLKLENVISRVNTDYILQADNDDFYLLHRIPELIEFLDTNPDYVAARGQLVNFEVYGTNGNTRMQVRGCRYSATAVYAPSVDSDLPLSRIDKVCQGMADFDYYSNWYSITRTKTLQKIWRDLITLPIKEVIVLEILSHVMLMNAGKLKVMYEPFYLRQSNTSVFGDTLVLNNDFLERCISNNAFSEFPTAIEKFMGFNTIEERKEVLKSIAGWLNVFVFNIRSGHLLRAGRRYRYATKVKRVPILGIAGEYFFSAIKKFLWQTPTLRKVRILEIEPFVIGRDRP